MSYRLFVKWAITDDSSISLTFYEQYSIGKPLQADLGSLMQYFEAYQANGNVVTRTN